jgi:hypothetical protein
MKDNKSLHIANVLFYLLLGAVIIVGLNTLSSWGKNIGHEKCEHIPQGTITRSEVVIDKWEEVEGDRFSTSTELYVSVRSGVIPVSREEYGQIEEGEPISVTVTISEYFVCDPGDLTESKVRRLGSFLEPKVIGISH